MENKEFEEKKDDVIEDKTRGLEYSEKRGTPFYLGYIIYTIILLVGVLGSIKVKSVEKVDLGDFGSITQVLFYSISLVAVKWLPLMSIVGYILTFFREKLKDVEFVYMAVPVVATVITIIGLFI